MLPAKRIYIYYIPDEANAADVNNPADETDVSDVTDEQICAPNETIDADATDVTNETDYWMRPME